MFASYHRLGSETSPLSRSAEELASVCGAAAVLCLILDDAWPASPRSYTTIRCHGGPRIGKAVRADGRAIATYESIRRFPPMTRSPDICTALRPFQGRSDPRGLSRSTAGGKSLDHRVTHICASEMGPCCAARALRGIEPTEHPPPCPSRPIARFVARVQVPTYPSLQTSPGAINSASAGDPGPVRIESAPAAALHSLPPPRSTDPRWRRAGPWSGDDRSSALDPEPVAPPRSPGSTRRYHRGRAGRLRSDTHIERFRQGDRDLRMCAAQSSTWAARGAP